MAYFEFVHNLGIHSWDIPALIALIVMIVMIFVHRSNQKNRADEFEKDLDKKIQEIREETGTEQDASYLLEHTKFGFCWLDLLALIVLIVVVVFFIRKNTKLKDEQKDLEDQLSELYAQDSIEESQKQTKA